MISMYCLITFDLHVLELSVVLNISVVLKCCFKCSPFLFHNYFCSCNYIVSFKCVIVNFLYYMCSIKNTTLTSKRNETQHI